MSRAHALLPALLIVGATTLAYLGSFDGGFVSDDRVAIEHNPKLQGLTADNLVAIFTTFDDSNYIPIKVLSLAVDQAVWGPQPFGYHLGNLALHIACALLLWRILLGMRFSAGAALLTALLWALHPLQVESVAFMAERKNVLSGAFFFAAFLLYMRFAASGGWRVWAAVLALFVLALLSKMNTVVLPALCLAYEAMLARRIPRRAWLASLPLFAAGALVVWYNLAGNTLHGARFHGGSAVATWLSSSTVVFRYLAAVVDPTHLRSFYYIPLHGSPLDPPVALALLGLAAFGAGLLWLAPRRPREAFWLFWFAVSLAPMLNIVPFPTMMQDRYMYLALVGLLAAPIGALDDALRGVAARRLAAAAAAGLALAWGLLTVRQVEVWTDELSLWRDWALEEWYLPVDVGPLRQPGSDDRLALLEAAAAAAPGDVVVQHNLGALRYERGDLPGALAALEAAQRLGADAHAMPLLNLGRARLRSGDPAGAADALRRAVALEPYAYWAHLNLARAALATGDQPTADAALAACLRIRPDAARSLEREFSPGISTQRAPRARRGAEGADAGRAGRAATVGR